MSETENAYTCLTEIQGCESFHLSPESSLEEIQRAYDTQIMIWHPDKNPGDAEALKQYKLIQRAYDTLKDPTRRAAHDQRLLDSLESASSEDDSKPSRVEEPPRQPRPPEDLGKIPTTATPFAFVDRDPQPGTPAYDAGLERGDAILRIGDASHLQDVQSELQAGLNRPVPVLVVDFSGRFLKKWVVPHSWDSWAPASLLGCQMSDSCPIDLWQHPVFPRPKTMDDEYEDEEEGLVRQGYRKRSLTPPAIPAVPASSSHSSHSSDFHSAGLSYYTRHTLITSSTYGSCQLLTARRGRLRWANPSSKASCPRSRWRCLR